uniref:cGMP-dependent protein kinase n=1 Tax=Dermatophagoides pteronyssinus TaxID=6956 RepID=A0A6P6Y4F3_DERPT|nr:cGMP-dependent protein kinase, isozyme 2 forms cD4/T1/T3A/T3B-like [Dermatophagoides pteronyssinus]
MIFDVLKRTIVGQALDAAKINELLNVLECYQFSSGDVVVAQGSVGSRFFIIQQGEFVVLVNDQCAAYLHEGQGFGEIALMYGVARTATVKCSVDGLTWAIDGAKYRSLVENQSKQTFERNMKFIDCVEIFKSLTKQQKGLICNAFIPAQFHKKDIIVKQGEPGDVLYVIISGVAEVWVDNRLVRQLSKNDYFGERALLYSEPRSATIIASTSVECVSVSRSMLEKVVGDLESLLFVNSIRQTMRGCNVFRGLTDTQINNIAKACKIKSLPAEYVLIGDQSRKTNIRYVILLEGYALVTLDGKKIRRLSRGEGFGEEYVLRSMSLFIHRIDTLTPCKIAIFTYENIFDMLDTTDISTTLVTNKKMNVILKMYIFRYLSSQQLDLLLANFEERVYRKGDIIFREGEFGSSFYIISEGELSVVKNGTRLRTLTKNDYFGERALLYEEPRSASIECLSDKAVLWVVTKSVFLSVVEGALLQHLEERIQLQDTSVTFEDLTFLGVIGSGAFGTVKKVKHKRTGTRFALKCVLRSAIIKYKQTKNIVLEHQIMAENDHPFILKLVKTFKDRKYIYFLLELCTGGDLYETLRTLGLLNRKQAQFYLASIIVAIEYLHERSVVFRDLKPENVLLDYQGYAKLIDFGCAKRIELRTNSIIGTPHYIAPEVITGKGYGTSCDIWAFGVILFEFMGGPLPFGADVEDQLQVYREILEAPLIFPDTITDEDAKNLIKKFLCRVPEVRIGCNLKGYADIKDHAFFSDFSWDSLLSRALDPPFVPKSEIYAESGQHLDLAHEDDEDAATELDAGQEAWDAGF